MQGRPGRAGQGGGCAPTPETTLHYTRHFNPRVAVAVARYLKAPVTYARSSPRDPAHEATFRKINPNALCPILVEPHRTLRETDAVACRLSELVGSDFWRGKGLRCDGLRLGKAGRMTRVPLAMDRHARPVGICPFNVLERINT